MSVSRRSFFARAGAIAAAQGLAMKAQQKRAARGSGGDAAGPSHGRWQCREDCSSIPTSRAKVALIKGENRRKNISDALVAIDDQIRPGLKTRKYVLIKPNGSDPTRALISTQADTVRGILDYLAPRFKGQVVVAECCGTPAKQATSQFGWDKIFAEHKAFNMQVRWFPTRTRTTTSCCTGSTTTCIRSPSGWAPDSWTPTAFVISSARAEDTQHGGGHHDHQEHGAGSGA